MKTEKFLNYRRQETWYRYRLGVRMHVLKFMMKSFGNFSYELFIYFVIQQRIRSARKRTPKKSKSKKKILYSSLEERNTVVSFLGSNFDLKLLGGKVCSTWQVFRFTGRECS